MSSPYSVLLIFVVRFFGNLELSKASAGSKSSGAESLFFPQTTSKYMNGVTRVSKDAFVKKIDYGPPMDAETDKNSEVLLFYNNNKSLPTKQEYKHQVQYDSGLGVGLLDVESATQNCDTMNVINVDSPGNTAQCVAIVGNYQGYQVQRWMRVPVNGGKLDPTEPLRAISRGLDKNGQEQFKPPDETNIKKHWDMLKTYFEGFEETMEELKKVAEQVAIQNTVIVMTCNMGQSELLMNFVCNAKAKGLDVSNVLVFPTDQETKELAEGLGLATFYDEKVSYICRDCLRNIVIIWCK